MGSPSASSFSFSFLCRFSRVSSSTPPSLQHLLFVLLFLHSYSLAAEAVTVTIDTDKVIGKVAREYGSFNFDWWPNSAADGAWYHSGILNVDLSEPKLKYLTARLAPAHLRIGGTPADTIIYEIGPHTSCKEGVNCLNMTRWQQIIDFVASTRLSLAFGISERYGKGTPGTWDPSNARNFLSYIRDNRHDYHIYGFEPGNELNLGKYPPDACGKDFLTMRKIINEIWPDPKRRPKLLGPDVTPDSQWLQGFLEVAASVVDVVTWHLYIGDGGDPKLPDLLLTPSFLNRSTSMSAPMVAQWQKYTGKTAELWCGETAAAFHSGQNHTTNTYLSGFWYLDQLGTLAKMNHVVQCRQTLVGGNYELIDKYTHLPNPDYWTLLLWKRIMGSNVLLASSTSSLLRSYAHCHVSVAGAVSLVLINLDTEEVNVQIDGFSGTPRLEYQLTTDDRRSNRIFLNGALLSLQENPIHLPNMPGRSVQNDTHITMAPLSYALFEFPNAHAQVCK